MTLEEVKEKVNRQAGELDLSENELGEGQIELDQNHRNSDQRIWMGTSSQTTYSSLETIVSAPVVWSVHLCHEEGVTGK